MSYAPRDGQFVRKVRRMKRTLEQLHMAWEYGEIGDNAVLEGLKALGYGDVGGRHALEDWKWGRWEGKRR